MAKLSKADIKEHNIAVELLQKDKLTSSSNSTAFVSLSAFIIVSLL